MACVQHCPSMILKFAKGHIMDVKKILGCNVKKYRKKKGFTQEYLAESIGISSKHLSKIEIGEKFVSAEKIEKISEALCVSPAALFYINEYRGENDDFSLQIEKLLEEKAREMVLSVKEGIDEIL